MSRRMVRMVVLVAIVGATLVTSPTAADAKIGRYTIHAPNRAEPGETIRVEVRFPDRSPAPTYGQTTLDRLVGLVKVRKPLRDTGPIRFAGDSYTSVHLHGQIGHRFFGDLTLPTEPGYYVLVAAMRVAASRVVTSTGPAREVAPIRVSEAGKPPPRPCDGDTATRSINDLFRALGSGDAAAVEAMFPSAESWRFRPTTADSIVSKDGTLTITPSATTRQKVARAVARHDDQRVVATFPMGGGWGFDMGQGFDDVLDPKPSGPTPSPSANRAAELAPLVREFAGMKVELVGAFTGRTARGEEFVSPAGHVKVDVYAPGNVLWRASSAALRKRGIAYVEGNSKLSIYCHDGRFQRVLLTPMRAIGMPTGGSR